MKLLVTGATGFLGKTLCQHLESNGHAVTGLGSRDADLTRPDALNKFGAGSFDQIYHLAVWTQAGDFCLHHPGEQWIINQAINTTVLAWWQRTQPQAKLICMGTSCAYDPNLELIESNYLVGSPIDSLYAYGMTKRMLLVGLRALHQQFGLRYLCLIPSTLYGPGYHQEGRQMHFIFDLIRKILRGHKHGEPVVLWGDGHQKRELVFLDDFVRITVHLADQRENELINIGAGEEHSIRQFAQRICTQTGFDFGQIAFDPSRYVGARSKCLVIDKLRSLIPDLEFTPLDAGLASTLNWFQETGCGL
jgi:GDP-L-fucose synthase